MSTEKVYLVTDGDYEDYQVLAVFSDKSQADTLADRLGATVEVESRCLNPPLSSFQRVVVLMDREGDSSWKVEWKSVFESGFQEFKPLDKEGAVAMCYICAGNDETQAIEGANDARVLLVANHLWPDMIEPYRWPWMDDFHENRRARVFLKNAGE